MQKSSDHSLVQNTHSVKDTPMMAQWRECKAQVQDCILLFRLGDFYEAFYEDAHIAAKELELTLTERQSIPMCGIPWHASDSYIDRLVAKGYRVAIAEQVENPKKAKGLVSRKVVRVISPGTTLSSSLQEKTHNYFCCLVHANNSYAIAFLDLGTASFYVLEADSKDILNELFRKSPRELLVSKEFQEKYNSLLVDISLNSSIFISSYHNSAFQYDTAYHTLTSHFSTQTLDGFGLKDTASSIIAAGALLQYVQKVLLSSCEHIRKITRIYPVEFLHIDRATLENLELIDPLVRGKEARTLLSVLDKTKTPMGARRLREWILRPLTNVEHIKARQIAIEEFVHKLQDTTDTMKQFISHFSQIRDLERQIAKIHARTLNPREYIAFKNSCYHTAFVKRHLSENTSPLIQKLVNKLYNLTEIADIIAQTLVDEPPVRLSDGNVIRRGVSSELDELYHLKTHSQEWLVSYQMKLKEETGIKTLKVSYNRMFGYYIEVSRGQTNKMPASFERRQTLVNAERYISPELKEYEQKILTADARIQEIEQELFEELQIKTMSYHKQVLDTAAALSIIDALFSLAQTAVSYGYVKPEINTDHLISIVEGRHPVIEATLNPGIFVPNDLSLDSYATSLMCITGPNMAGKSTYIRQAALLVIMAQIGSFIPAKSATIGIVDKVFARIGASDDLAKGHSTFMVEMAETASILNQATSRSLVILDEIGRGTSTFDGISIAWAICEHLTKPHQEGRIKTLFATHYFELTELENKAKGVQNYTVAVAERGGDITFLHKIIKGKADKSYGIHVAKLAGLPKEVIERAKAILVQLESKNKDSSAELTLFPIPSSTIEKKISPYIQATEKKQNKEPEQHPLAKEIKSLNLNEISPMQALQFLFEKQNEMRKVIDKTVEL